MQIKRPPFWRRVAPAAEAPAAMPVTERDITEKLGSVPAVVAGLRKPAQCPMW